MRVATLADLVIKLRIDDKGLAAKIKATEKNFQKVNDKISTMALAGAGLGPAILPVLGAVTVAAAGLAAPVLGAGAALGVFAAVSKSVFGELQATSTQYTDLTGKIKLYGKEAAILKSQGKDNEKVLKKQSDAMLELRARFALLPPAQRAATENYLDMKDSVQDFVDTNKPAVYSLIARGTLLISKNVSKLQPLFDLGAKAAGRLMTAIEGAVGHGAIETFVAWLTTNGAKAIDSFGTIFKNVGIVVGEFFSRAAGSGQGMLAWIAKISGKWAAWSQNVGKGGINDFFAYVQTQTPKVVTLLTNLWAAVSKIVQAITPLAPISLAVAGGLAALIGALPVNLITTIVGAFVLFGVAMRAYAVASAIATAAQWAQNSAFLASPITWIVLAVLVLAAGIYYLATRTQFFQTVWNAVWGFLKTVGAWFAGPFAGFFVTVGQKIAAFAQYVWHMVSTYFGFWYGLFFKIQGWGNSAVNYLKSKFSAFVSYISSIPGKISGKLSSMWNGLKSGFRAAINYVVGAWNRLHFTIPSFSILGKSFGGGTIGVPQIPGLAKGGIVQAKPGGTLVNVGEGGRDEAVVPLGRGPNSLPTADDRPTVVQIVPGGEREFRTWIKKSIRVKGPLDPKAVPA